MRKFQVIFINRTFPVTSIYVNASSAQEATKHGEDFAANSHWFGNLKMEVKDITAGIPISKVEKQ